MEDRSGTATVLLLATAFFTSPNVDQGSIVHPTIARPTRREDETSNEAAESVGEGHVLLVSQSSRQLVDDFLGAGVEEQDRHLARVQRVLKTGSSEITKALHSIVAGRGPVRDARARSLALEALAAIRAPHLDDAVLFAVEQAIGDAAGELQHAAIAAAGDLPRSHRTGLVPAMAWIAEAPDVDVDVRIAAGAFVRENSSGAD